MTRTRGRTPVRATLAACGVAVLALAVGAGAAAVASDPAETALRDADAYASPAALGAEAPAALARLRGVAARFEANGQPVKLAVVAGPVGARNLRVYAVRLRSRLGFPGTLAVTAPGRPAVVVGPRTPAAITGSLRRARVNRRRDPVARVSAAARAAVPPSPNTTGSIARGLAIVLGLAVLGGLWAVAWGLRRDRRRRATAVSDARAGLRVRLDALEARSAALARRPDLPPAARALLDQAAAAADAASAETRGALSREAIDRAAAEAARGMDAAARAAALAGEALDPSDPFAGLCAVDPGHGEATAIAPTADRPDPVPVCADCAAAAEAGEPRGRRLVPVGGRPVPFDEAPAPGADGA
jgi:hypothetical protein